MIRDAKFAVSDHGNTSLNAGMRHSTPEYVTQRWNASLDAGMRHPTRECVTQRGVPSLNAVVRHSTRWRVRSAEGPGEICPEVFDVLDADG